MAKKVTLILLLSFLSIAFLLSANTYLSDISNTGAVQAYSLQVGKESLDSLEVDSIITRLHYACSTDSDSILKQYYDYPSVIYREEYRKHLAKWYEKYEPYISEEMMEEFKLRVPLTLFIPTRIWSEKNPTSDFVGISDLWYDNVQLRFKRRLSRPEYDIKITKDSLTLEYLSSNLSRLYEGFKPCDKDRPWAFSIFVEMGSTVFLGVLEALGCPMGNYIPYIGILTLFEMDAIDDWCFLNCNKIPFDIIKALENVSQFLMFYDKKFSEVDSSSELYRKEYDKLKSEIRSLNLSKIECLDLREDEW